MNIKAAYRGKRKAEMAEIHDNATPQTNMA